MKNIYFLILAIMGVGVLPVMAQQERKFIREGNSLFEKQDFEKAEVEYRKAADKKTDSYEAAFNMADALYKQKKYDEALQQFSALAKDQKDKQRLGEIYHNIGNTLLSMEKAEESIEAYKESLRNRPLSQETKYNLEFARNKQQQDQQNKDQNKDNQNQDQKDKQDQNKDQQDQNKDQNKDKQDQKQDQQNQDKDKQDQENKDQQQPQPQPGKISKEDAERLLEALQNDEKNVQEKVQQQKAKEQRTKKMKIEKDW